MIGHALLTFNPAQEDKVLTTVLRPFISPTGVYGPGPCLLQVVSQGLCMDNTRGARTIVGSRFDALCHRFGTVRINNAIRNRILTNRLWRELGKDGVYDKQLAEVAY